MARGFRLAFFTAHYHPHRGGVEKYVGHLAHELKDLGCESIVVTSTIASNVPHENIDSIPVYRIPTINLAGGEYPVPYPSRGLNAAIRAVERFDPDVIVTNTRYFFTSALGVRFAKRRSVPVVHIDHGSDSASVTNPLANVLAKVIDRFVGGYVISNADRCAGVSEDVNGFIGRRFGRTCDATFYNSVSTTTPLVSEPRKGVVYGYAGRLIEEKGVLLAVEAFKKVKESIPDARMRIAGTGPLKQRIEQDSDVDYVGLLGPDEMPAFYASIDVFLLPTWYREGFATAILEAGMHGKLVITTERGSARELIADPSYGTIVPQRDLDALVEAMLVYAQPHPEVASKLRKRVLERFTWKRTAQRFHEVLTTWLTS